MIISRSIFKLMVLLTIGSTMLVSLVHAAAHDESQLGSMRAALLPADCEVEGSPSAPCFLSLPGAPGIRLGVTTLNDARLWLSQHPWIERVTTSFVGAGNEDAIITWTWSGFQPPWISTLSTGMLRVEHDRVVQMQIDTLLAFNDIWMLMGPPKTGVLDSILRVVGMPQYIHFALYEPFWVRNEVRCPLRSNAFWDTPTRIVWGEAPPVQLETYDLPRWFLHPPRCRR